jgi:oligopeptide/dipeptide ABC transporter ATP-binding protein
MQQGEYLMENKTILDVHDLSVNFYSNQRCNKALRGVSFSLKRGHILSIVGESGCGKSVTANAIMRLLPDLSRIEGGTIAYYGRDRPIEIEKLKKNGKEMRSLRGKDISMIFQDPMTALNPVFTVGYQLGEMLETHQDISKRQQREQVISLLQDMRVPEARQRVNEYPHQYSGGMRQRAMIGMAMACHPRILIADEPTTALDVTIQAQIFDLMLALKRENDMAILLITHDMGVVSELADDVAVMYMGNIVEQGTAGQVIGSPAHPYTKALLKSIPILGRGKRQKLEPIRGTTPNPYQRPEGCQFAPRCDFAGSRCMHEMPEETIVEDGHMVRCFRARR